jgi:hypothetical protein
MLHCLLVDGPYMPLSGSLGLFVAELLHTVKTPCLYALLFDWAPGLKGWDLAGLRSILAGGEKEEVGTCDYSHNRSRGHSCWVA